jgi:hypothetical protein
VRSRTFQRIKLVALNNAPICAGMRTNLPPGPEDPAVRHSYPSGDVHSADVGDPGERVADTSARNIKCMLDKAVKLARCPGVRFR